MITRGEVARRGLMDCGLCGKPKPLSEYHRNKSSKSGLNRYCKECLKQQKHGRGGGLAISFKEWVKTQ